MHARKTLAVGARRCKRLNTFKHQSPWIIRNETEGSLSAKNGLVLAIIGALQSKTLSTVGRDENPYFSRGFASSSSANPQNVQNVEEDYDVYSSVTSSSYGEEKGNDSAAEPIWNVKYRAKVEEVVFGIKHEPSNTENINVLGGVGKEASRKGEGGQRFESAAVKGKQKEAKWKFVKELGKIVKVNDGFAKEKENIASKTNKGGRWDDRKKARGKLANDKFEKENDRFGKKTEKFAKKIERFAKDKDKSAKDKDKFANEKDKFAKAKDEFVKRKDKFAKEKENIAKVTATAAEEEEEEEEDEGEMLQPDENIDALFPQYSPEEKERTASELAKAISSFQLSQDGSKTPPTISKKAQRKITKEKENFTKAKAKIANELEDEEGEEHEIEGEVLQTDTSMDNWYPQLSPEEKEWRSSKLAKALLEASLARPDDESEEEGGVREIDQKSLSVGIIGPPNAGKSTLTNFMVGAKVAAVSRKTNTTTHEVLGVLTKGDTQILFFDTPGLMLNKYGETHKADVRQRVESAWSSVELYDFLIVIIDAHRHLTRPDPRVTRLVNKLGEKVHPKQKRILCMNKVDLVEVKKDLLKLASGFGQLPGYDKFYMISGMKGSGVKDLVKYLMEQAVKRPWDEDPGDMNEDFLKNTALEVVREKMLHNIHQEIPYEIDHRLIDWKEKEDGSLRIEQHFIVHKHTHRRILVGKNGSKIWEIGTSANEELRRLFKRTVHLIIQVRLKS